MPTPEDNQKQEVQSSPALRDKRVLPEGVVPKQAQGYVIAGLAVLILMAVMFSKNHATPAAKVPEPAPLATSSDLNQRKIQELEQDLSADQRQSQQQAAQKQGAGPAPSTAIPNPLQPGVSGPATQLPAAAAQPVELLRDPDADAEKTLAFKARFASNLVSRNDGASRMSAESSDFPTSLSGRPASLPPTPDSRTASASSAVAGNKRPPEVSVNAAHGQPYVVFEGTTIIRF